MNESELKVICSNCKKKYKVKNPHSIKMYTCKQCGEKIVVNPFSDFMKEYRNGVDKYVIPISSIFIEDGFSLADRLNYIIDIYFLNIHLSSQAKRSVVEESFRNFLHFVYEILRFRSV